MRKAIGSLLFLFLSTSFILFSNNPIHAQLYLNEIYPHPTSGENEWIELYNDDKASASADLSNYLFDDDADFSSDAKSGKIIPLSGILPDKQTCYWELSNYLNNGGDSPTLFNKNGTIVDNYSYTNSQQKKSYARYPDGGQWQANVNPTKSLIKCSDLLPTPTPTPTPSPSPLLKPSSTPSPNPTPSPTPTPLPSTNIYLSEAMVDPETNENEWVELYNGNDYPVSLIDWYIDDKKDSGSAPKKFSLSIPAKSYQTVDLSSSILNNSGDTIRLLNNDKVEVDFFDYSNSTKGLSWGRKSFSNKGYCQQNPSKNQPNNLCSQETAPTPTLITTAKPKSSLSLKKRNKTKQKLMAVSQPKKIVKLPQPKKGGDVLAAKTEKFIPSFPLSKNLSSLYLIQSLSFYALVNSGLIILRFLTQKIIQIV